MQGLTVPLEVCSLFLDQYGKSLDNRSKFRLVWSTDQFEVRRSLFEYSLNGIYIGLQEEIRRVPKYMMIQDRWILEELVLGQAHPDLLESFNGTYEPLYVFESSAGIPLPVTLKILEIVMSYKMRQISSMAIRSRILTEQEEKTKRIDEADSDLLSNTSVLQSHLHHGESNFTRGIANGKYR